MKRFGAFVALLLLLTLGALALRLPELSSRPFHGDEAVHAVKFQELWEKGVYRYDPNEYHGPTIYYAALPSVRLNGRHTFAETQEADYRLPIALVGGAMLLWLGLLADGMGRRSALCAAVLLALSPAFVFYSRYFIQETFLVCFTLGMLACGWRYARTLSPNTQGKGKREKGKEEITPSPSPPESPSPPRVRGDSSFILHPSSFSIWLLAAGLCAGLMIASKETALLTFGTCVLALILTALWTRWVDRVSLDLRRLWNGKAVLLALGVALLTACLFLSGFFSNPSGPRDYLRAYTPWLNRAGGTEIHRHPWSYYLQLLLWNHQPRHPIWSEALIVGLALVGIVVALLPKEKSRLEGSPVLARFLVFTTLLLTFLYSVIPYKTPWCVLSFLLGMILMAGIGAVALLRAASALRFPGNVGVPPAQVSFTGIFLASLLGLLLLAATAQLGWQSYQSSYLHNTDQSNPYVYSQPVQDIVNLKEKVEKIASASPEDDQMVIKVYSVDGYYWPLPWYLRRFPNVGYWTEVPKDAEAPLVLASSPEFDDTLQTRLGDTHLANTVFEMRPGVFFRLWPRIHPEWEDYLKAKKATEKSDTDN